MNTKNRTEIRSVLLALPLAALTLAGTARAQCSDPPSGLLGWWPGDTDASEIQCGNHGVLSNGAAAGATGHVAGAFTFDGVDDYVAFPTSRFEDAPTVALWVQTSTASQAIMDGGPTFFTWRLGIDSAGKAFYQHGRNGQGGYAQVTGSSVINDGAFHFVAFQTDQVNDRILLYVDGVLEASYTETSSLFTSWAYCAPGDAKLGLSDTRLLPGPLYFQGVVDELDLYNRVLSAADVQSLFLAGTAGKCAPVSSYCTAGTTANGCNALISATGRASLSQPSGFDITVNAVEGAKTGILFFGTTGQTAIPWGAGSSLRCVLAPTKRTGVQATGGAAGTCQGVMSLDFNAWMLANPSRAPAAGDRVYFQAWFRDPPSAKTTSLSDALAFGVCP